MPATEESLDAVALLQERSRDALIERLTVAQSEMDEADLVAFIADLLLASGADRDILKQRLVDALSRTYGRRSEKASADQIQLFAMALRVISGGASEDQDEADAEDAGSCPDVVAPTPTAAELIEQTNAEVEAEAEAQRRARKEARKARREAAALQSAQDGDATPWPSNLPVRVETREVPAELASCDDCGHERPVIRHESSWRIEYTTSAEVVVTLTPVVACASHHGGPVNEPVPPKPVDKGQLGFSLAANILWRRTTHNLPSRRIAEMLQAEGVPVSEHVIHRLISVTGKRSEPVVKAIRTCAQQAALVNLDDTHTDVYDDDGTGHRKRRRARVWLALGDERFAYYFATRTWSTEEAEKALGTITGVLQGDGYRGFPGYAERCSVKLAGCMAHLRRKLRAAVLAHDPRAIRAMALVQGLYRVEKLAKLRGLDAEGRLALRQERSVIIMAELLDWAREVAPTIVTGSPLGKAWTYLDNQQDALQTYLHDGRVSIDNSAAERGLRRHTIGRKLWLFFRDQDKLEHVANIMSILTTARLHGVDELAYLRWLLEQLARREWSPEAAVRLLPNAWQQMMDEQAQQVTAGQP